MCIRHCNKAVQSVKTDIHAFVCTFKRSMPNISHTAQLNIVWCVLACCLLSLILSVPVCLTPGGRVIVFHVDWTDLSVLRRAVVAPPGTCQKGRMLRPPIDLPSQHLHLNKTLGDSFMLKTGKWRSTRKERDCPSATDNLTCSYQLANIPVVSWDEAGKTDPNADSVI